MAEHTVGLAQGAVVLAPHSPHWKALFEQERLLLQEILGAHTDIQDIHHIGSTSLPGLSAKPIIDILVVLHQFSDMPTLHSLLEAQGYEYRENGSNELRTLFVKGAPEKRTHHIHFTEYQSLEWKKAFLFWEYLQTHPKTVEAYNSLKQELAKKHPLARDEYSKGKAPFIKAVIEKAQNENRP